MADLNEVVAPIEEQVTTDVVVPTVEPVTVSTDTSVLDTATDEHPVLFFVIMGVVCLAGVGIPLMIWYIIRLRKKLRQYEGKDKETEQAPATEGTEKASNPAPQKEAETKDAKTDKK